MAAILAALCFQTANAGWIRQKTNTLAWFRDIYFLDHKKGWLVGTDGVFYSTEDGGDSWKQAKKFTTDSIIQVFFESGSTGWLLCERNVYTKGPEAPSYLRRTTDGGLTWQTVEFQDAGRERVARIVFRDDGRATAVGEGGVVYELQEDRVSWKKSRTAILFLLLDGAFADDRAGVIVGAGGTILFTGDAGRTWQEAAIHGERDTRFTAVDLVGQRLAWAVGHKGRVFRSVSGGRLWTQADSGVTANLNDVYFTSAENGWAVGDNGVIIRSRDGGLTWAEEPSRTSHRLERVTFANDRAWAVGFGGTVLTYKEAPESTVPGPVLIRK